MSLVPPRGPLRLLAVASLVNTFGNGLFYTSAALFYTRSVGLSPRQVAVGPTIAGLLALFVGVPSGYLADLRGAREVLVVLLVAQAGAMACFALVHGFVGFLVTSIGYICLDKAANAVRQALVVGSLPPADQVSGRAYLRSVTNLGLGAGAAVAGAAIAIGTREAYVSLLLADAVTYFLCAFVIARLPRRDGVKQAAEGGMLIALKDVPYVVVFAVAGFVTVPAVAWAERSRVVTQAST